MNISIEHSGAWLLLIAAVAALTVAWLYFYKSRQDDWGMNLKTALASLRFMVLLLIGFMLLEPYFVRLIDESEKPRLLIYSDHSASSTMADRAMVNAFISETTGDLSGKYSIVHMPFGAAPVRPEDSASLDSLYTDYGAVMESIEEDFYGENIGAVVIASDGIQNKGRDPRYMSLKTDARLFTVATGDTNVRADIELNEVLNNRLAFLNNDFEVKARVHATKLNGRSATVKLLRDGRVIAEQSVLFDGDEANREISFIATADRIGLNKYVVEVDRLSEEVNVLNNAAEAFIEVLDNRTRVTVLAHAPHPDIAMIRRAIESSEQYSVQTLLIKDWDKRTANSDMFILHGLPANVNDLNVIQRIRDAGKPMLAVLSGSLSIRHFNELNTGLRIEASGIKQDEVGAALNEQFNLFNVEKNNDLRRLPPLHAPFGDYIARHDHQVLLHQKVGSIATEKPLIMFAEQDGLKTGILCAEGWWKWRLFESNLPGAGYWTDQLVRKTVQYLAIKQKRTRINVTAPRKVQEREEVVFHAEFYNESFELNNDPAMDLALTDSAGKTIEYRFKPHGNAYRLSTGTLPPGEYAWKASVTSNGQNFTESGEFIVAENRSEYMRLVADHRFMRDWAKEKGGDAYDISELSILKVTLQDLESAKPVLHTSREWTGIIEWKWVLFVLTLIIATEWFVRKYTGYA